MEDITAPLHMSQTVNVTTSSASGPQPVVGVAMDQPPATQNPVPPAQDGNEIGRQLQAPNGHNHSNDNH